MENEKAKNLAERIALLLQEGEKGTDDFSALRASLEQISERLDKIEFQLSVENPKSEIQNLKSNHPSQERFAIDEAFLNEAAATGFSNAEKACTFEPNGKPCDHCAMCSSRGF